MAMIRCGTIRYVVWILFVGCAFPDRVTADLVAEPIPHMLNPSGHGYGGTARVNDGGIDKVLVWGGRAPSGHTATAECYTPGPDLWEWGTSLPLARSGLGAFTIGGTAYSVGGEGPSSRGFNSDVYRYECDSWVQLASYPENTWEPEAGVVNGKAYVFGGRRGYGQSYPQNYEYDPIGDQWTPKADMRISVRMAGTATWNNKVHVFGGLHNQSESVGWWLPDIQVYDPGHDIWDHRLDAMPALLGGMNGVMFNEEFYLFAQIVWDENLGAWVDNEDVYIYSFDDDLWRTTPFDAPAGASYRNEIVEIGGYAYLMDTGDGSNLAYRVLLPEPATLSLLALGGLLVIKRRR